MNSRASLTPRALPPGAVMALSPTLFVERKDHFSWVHKFRTLVIKRNSKFEIDGDERLFGRDHEGIRFRHERGSRVALR